jgi:hypothetical protein
MIAAGFSLAAWALTAAPTLAQAPGAAASEPLAAVATKAEAQAKTACRGAGGKARPCASRTRKGPSKARVATPMISQCRDVISHRLARCGGPNAEPVPAN